MIVPSSAFENRYQLISKVGEGSYGSVYDAIDILFNKQVVLKIGRGSLRSEAAVYSILHKNWSPIGIPKVFTYVKSRRDYLVMEKLGENIRHYWNLCGRRFSLKTLVMLGTQMISRLESVHNRGMVHGDIKEDNFVMGAGTSGTVYIIDFGLSTSYVNIITGAHIHEDYDAHVLGTISYASINTHNLTRLSRRDDVEALAYLLIRLLKGQLPWEDGLGVGKNASFHANFKRAGQKKALTTVESLCAEFPEQIKQFVTYARGLKFQERPDYSYLQQLLREALIGENLSNDGIYDWMENGAVAVGVDPVA